jgi:SHS2 domain-containing protein
VVKQAAGKGFEVIDHTADVGIIVHGTEIKQVFANAATALFSLITELENIREELKYDVEVASEDRESLLVEWLNELIYLFDTEHVLLKRFDIQSLSNTKLKITCCGEKIDPSRHKIKTGVKAATYHMLRIDKDDKGYKAQVIFDI